MPAEVDKEKCVGCGSCEGECPVEAIKVVDGVATVKKDDCVSCGACKEACPAEAIEIKD